MTRMSPDSPPKCAPRRLVLHVLDTIALSVMLVIQGSLINYYIIAYFESSASAYFWFLADFVCLFMFAGALTVSYRFLNPSPRAPPQPPPSKHRTLLGAMPLSYISWLAYSALLVSKIAILVRVGVLYQLKPSETFGPQLLQVAIALSGAIFFLLVEGHNIAPRGSPRHLFATVVCGRTAIEVLDTVGMLSLLHIGAGEVLSSALETPSNGTAAPPARLLKAFRSSAIAARNLETPILTLCSLSFFLPALALYRLAVADGRLVALEKPVAVIYSVLHMALIDLPYLVMRMYLWMAHDHSSTVLLMKNVFGLLLGVRNLVPDVMELWRRHKLATVEVAALDADILKVDTANGRPSELVELRSEDRPRVVDSGDAVPSTPTST